jgi:hypothetical protein
MLATGARPAIGSPVHDALRARMPPSVAQASARLTTRRRSRGAPRVQRLLLAARRRSRRCRPAGAPTVAGEGRHRAARQYLAGSRSVRLTLTFKYKGKLLT